MTMKKILSLLLALVLCVGGMIVLLILGVGLLGEGLQRAYKE